MSAITWTTGFTGTPDDFDLAAAHFMVDRENERRAALDPPGTPLPKSPASALKSSAETVIRQVLTDAWTGYVRNAHQQGYVGGTKVDDAKPENFRALFEGATTTGRNAAITALRANQA